jgi:hypothetical protein
MSLRFIGKDAESPNNGSPTVWVDEEDDSIVIQGWKITDATTLAAIEATAPIPGHETVLRLPRRMAPILGEVVGDDLGFSPLLPGLPVTWNCATRTRRTTPTGSTGKRATTSTPPSAGASGTGSSRRPPVAASTSGEHASSPSRSPTT